MGQLSNLRASDAERERIAELLRRAHAEGRLAADEFEDRLRLALSAQTYGELDSLVADLPSEPGVRPAPVSPLLPARPSTNGLAIASLVLGCAGFFFLWGVGPLLSLIFGIIAKQQIDRSNGLQTGRGLAVAGVVLGIIGLVITALFIALIVAGAILTSSSSSVGSVR